MTLDRRPLANAKPLPGVCYECANQLVADLLEHLIEVHGWGGWKDAAR